MEKIMTKIGDLWEVKEFITFKISPYFSNPFSRFILRPSDFNTLSANYEQAENTRQQVR